jgi:hypothetical protein
MPRPAARETAPHAAICRSAPRGVYHKREHEERDLKKTAPHTLPIALITHELSAGALQPSNRSQVCWIMAAGGTEASKRLTRMLYRSLMRSGRQWIKYSEMAQQHGPREDGTLLQVCRRAAAALPTPPWAPPC